MRLLLIIILFTITNEAFSQMNDFDSYVRDSLGRLIPSYTTFTITSYNNREYYERAKCLIQTHDGDSLRFAYRMLKKLQYFDSLKYSADNLKYDFATIEDINYRYLTKNILGTWKFRWSGSNWGTDITDESVNQKLIFTDSLVSFIDNDTLVRRTKYLITNRYSFPYSKELVFYLYFVDNKALWSFKILTNGRDYFARSSFSIKNTGLRINEMTNCLCGCPESIYLKTNCEK